MSSLHVYYKRELHLVCWGPHWSICFPGVWDCLVQVLTPFTHPKRVERNWQWCKGIALLLFLNWATSGAQENGFKVRSGVTHNTANWKDWCTKLCDDLVSPVSWCLHNFWAVKMVKMLHSRQEPWQYLVGGKGWGWHKQSWRRLQHVRCWKHSLITYSWKDSK